MILQSWTSERIERLKTLYAQGKTCSEIADDLGFTTRNAVIGKVHRLSLELRGPTKGKTIEKRVRKFKEAKAKARSKNNAYFASQFGTPKPAARQPVLTLPVCTTAEPSRNLPFGSIAPGQCHYPTSPDGQPISFCGHPVDGNSSWCPAHRARVTAPAPRRASRERVAA